MLSYRKSVNLPEKITKTLTHLFNGYSGTPNCLEFNVPTTITTKMDGTQLLLRVDLNHQDPEIEIWGHSSKKYCFKGSLQKLEMGQQKGSKMIPYTYQYVVLYPIVSEVMPKFIAMMREMNLVESDFYCEMILPGKSPLNINYSEDMLNKLYLFNHVYMRNNEYQLDEVNEITKERYEKYNILTVPLFRSYENFSVRDFNDLIDLLDDKNMEGFMLSQKNCLIKLKTHYYEANIPDMKLIKINENDQYQVNLKMCLENYINRINRIKIFNGDDIDIIDIEIKKEYGHDNCSDYVNISKDSDLVKRIMISIEKEKGVDFVKKNYDLIFDKINNYFKIFCVSSEKS